MKTFMKYLFCFFMVCAVGMMAQAADKSVNRKMGYFDNTRTVLLFLPQSNDRGSYAASYIAKEMDGGAVAGSACFKGAADADGRVEIGYGLEKPLKNRVT